MASTDSIPDVILEGFLGVSRPEFYMSLEELQDIQEADIDAASLVDTGESGDEEGSFVLYPYLQEDRGTLSSK